MWVLQESSSVGCGSCSWGQTSPVLTVVVAMERGGRYCVGFSAERAMFVLRRHELRARRLQPERASLAALDSADQHSFPPRDLYKTLYASLVLCVGAGGCLHDGVLPHMHCMLAIRVVIQPGPAAAAPRVLGIIARWRVPISPMLHRIVYMYIFCACYAYPR